MKVNMPKLKAVACLCLLIFVSQSYGASTFPDAPKSYQEIAAFYEKGETPTLEDFPSESFFSSPYYLWNAPSSLIDGLLVTIAINDPALGVIKYSVGGNPGPVNPFLEETKANIRTGRISYLKATSAGTELQNLFNNYGCMHKFSYRKNVKAISGFDIIVSQLIIWGNCSVQIAVPYLYRYFILLHANDAVETTAPTDLHVGNAIVGHLESGTKLTAVSVNQDWVSVRLANESVARGWVRLKNLKPIHN